MVRVESVNESSVVEQLDYVFNPRSVAVIGASNRIGTWGFGVLNRLLGNPKRKVYPVNSKSDEIMGIKAYRKITEIPEPVDFAVLSVPPAKTPEVMRECVAKGVKAALVITGGLAESGEEGAKLEKELVEIARKGGIRFIGPNSMGHINTHSSFSTLAWMEDVKPGGVAFLSQSGTYGQRVVRTGTHRGIGFSKFVSDGNEADIHLEDYIEYLAEDEETRIIAAYVEGLREGRRFFKLAREITRKKPIIIMKSGSTKGSARAAKSHTASLSGSDQIYDAAFKQSGVIRVEDEVELFDVVNALVSLPLPRGNRTGILTEGGGIGVVMAEATEKVGLELPNFSYETTETLRSLLPSRCSYGNPTDITDLVTSGNLVIFSCLWAIMEDPNIDIAILLGGIGASSYFSNMIEKGSFSNNEEFQKMVKSLEEQELKNLDLIREKIDRLGKPLVYVNLMPRVMAEPESFNLLRDRGIPIYPNPRRAARALRHVVNYTEYLNK
ncbi:MAG: CoA-binding protein [Thermodesulfobacteriota bacterium]